MIRLWRLPGIAQLLVAAALAETHHLLAILRVHRAGPVNTSKCGKCFPPHVLSHWHTCTSFQSFSTWETELILLCGNYSASWSSRECNPRGRWLSLVLKTGHEGNRELRVSGSHMPCCTPLSTSLNQEQRLWQNWGISTPKPNGAQHPGYSEEMSKSSNQATSKHTLTKNEGHTIFQKTFECLQPFSLPGHSIEGPEQMPPRAGSLRPLQSSKI